MEDEASSPPVFAIFCLFVPPLQVASGSHSRHQRKNQLPLESTWASTVSLPHLPALLPASHSFRQTGPSAAIPLFPGNPEPGAKVLPSANPRGRPQAVAQGRGCSPLLLPQVNSHLVSPQQHGSLNFQAIGSERESKLLHWECHNFRAFPTASLSG